MNGMHLNGFLRESFMGEDSQTEIKPSPLDGFSKQRARRRVQSLIGDTRGMFRDDNWSAVHRIFDRLGEAGLNYHYGCPNNREFSGGYFRNDRGQIAGKQWEFGVEFINDKGRPTEITGVVIASFGGTVEQAENDYLGADRPYDICAYVTN